LPSWPDYLQLPDKRVCDLNERQRQTFRDLMGLNASGVPVSSVPSLTPEETAHRDRRERWKRGFAGKGRNEPSLLIRKEQITRLGKNAKVDATARQHREGILTEAEEAAALPGGFFTSFIPDQGPWNPGGNFCPNCVHKKSPEGINNYFWNWDWRDPERLECPHCSMVFPNADFNDNAKLVLPRLGLVYRMHALDAEIASGDWQLGDAAGKFVGQPIHVSFSGNIRALRINWAIRQLKSLSLGFAITHDKSFVRPVFEILTRFAQVYPNYPLQSYFQDVVDADPGFAVDHADDLPTAFKRNACIGVYDGSFGYNHEKTTTRSTRVATGLWGASRIARELTTTGDAFLTAFQAYDLTKSEIDPSAQKVIEQQFLLELYLDTRAYEYITNKAGNIRAARVAFGQAYANAKETRDGVKGFHAILEGQFHPDGSTKETPLYGHKPIGENLWRIPEMLRGTQDLYANSLLPAAFETFSRVVTPWATHPPLDDTFVGGGIPTQTFDIARERFGIKIPGVPGPPSEFALYNSDLSKRPRRKSAAKALNNYFEGRHLACTGFGSGATATQIYVLGEDGHHGHRHAAPLNLQFYTHGWEVFPDLGYICDHPGNQWVKATPSHQTVTIDGSNGYSDEHSKLLAFNTQGTSRYIDTSVGLRDGSQLRRAVVLLKKTNGWPVLIDLFEASGGKTQDYSTRTDAPLGSFRISEAMKRRRTKLYQDHSFYELKNFQTSGKTLTPVAATWGAKDRTIRATVLTGASELMTYQSPGWRNQHEITAQSGKYLDTMVLRNRGKAGQFLVVYDTGPSPVAVQLEATTDEHFTINIQNRSGKDWRVSIPLASSSKGECEVSRT
jgi:hypothetical protein